MDRRRTDRHSYHNFLSTCSQVVSDVVRLLRTDCRNSDYIESSLLRIQSLATNVLRVSQMFPQCMDLVENLQIIIADFQCLKRPECHEGAYKVEEISDGMPGRPSFAISREQLQFLLDLNFSATDIAKLLQVSRSTVTRRLRYFRMSVKGHYSGISDDNLDALVRPIVEQNPHLGYRSMMAQLQTKGHHLQESRVRDTMIRVLPSAVALRWCDTIHRRSYRVAGPNSLWHIDGNHKLIKIFTNEKWKEKVDEKTIIM